MFEYLPIAALIEEKIFCMHGGLSPELTNPSMLMSIKRPYQVPDKGLICDILWSDPDDEVLSWGYNERGVSYTFSKKVVEEFMQKNDLELILRAH